MKTYRVDAWFERERITRYFTVDASVSLFEAVTAWIDKMQSEVTKMEIDILYMPREKNASKT